MKTTDSKICLSCSEVFHKRKTESWNTWNLRKYCCRKCYLSAGRSQESRAKQSASTLGLEKSASHKKNIGDGIRARFLANVAIEKSYMHLTVISDPWIEKSRCRVTVRCVCGKEFVARVNNLKTGSTTSCGCKRHETLMKRNTTHGMAPRSGRHKLYRTWAAIIQRCTNRKNPKYEDYGGRGITVCKEWAESFEVFLAYVGERPFPKAEIDRKDNSGNYEPGNVKWSTRQEQTQNTRRNHVVSYDGTTLVITEWARRLGWSYGGMVSRLKRLTLSEALVKKIDTIL